LPELAVPVLNTNNPLTPLLPAFEELNNNEPLAVNELYPLTTDTLPPLDDADVPADNTNSPPVPLLPDPTVTYTDPPRPEIAVPDPT